MDHAMVEVLFLSQGTNSYARLQRHLEEIGCRCRVANCAEHGLALIDQQAFDLLLSTHPVHLGSALIARLEDSSCSVFYRLPVEDGWWWVPIVERGKKCLGAPALRPEEFVETVDRIVSDARLSKANGARKAQPLAA